MFSKVLIQEQEIPRFARNWQCCWGTDGVKKWRFVGKLI